MPNNSTKYQSQRFSIEMELNDWEIIGEISLRPPSIIDDAAQASVCLCSRVFVKNKNDTDAWIVDRDHLSEVEDGFNEYEANNSQFSKKVAEKINHNEKDPDANSCYHSASASHTDNYCSTDEHEQQHPFVRLHSSDSGADISEHHFENATKTNEEPKESSQSYTPPTITDNIVENATEQVNIKNLDEEWSKFWNSNGENIIWSSWIAQYSEYINPQYQKNGCTNKSEDQGNAISPQIQQESEIQINLEVDTSALEPSSSSQIQAENDWSVPILSNDSYLRLSIDSDNLLSPRCGSANSSIPFTIGTTDSMTNVTKTSISSFGFCSSEVSSNSSSDMSRMSQDETTSSIGSPSIIHEQFDKSIDKLYSDDIAMDVDAYWQILWQQHFHEQYNMTFQHFQKSFELKKVASDVLNATFIEKFDRENRQILARRSNKQKRSRKVKSELLPSLVAGLNLMNKSTTDVEENGCIDGGEEGEGSRKDYVEVVNTKEMAALGLPTSFASKQFSRIGKRMGGDDDDDKRNPDNRSFTLKRSHESDTEEVPEDRIASAFSLMGYFYEKTSSINADSCPEGTPSTSDNKEIEEDIYGEVVFRKKHIRLHNRALKFVNFKPSHTYFDDDGNPYPDKKKVVLDDEINHLNTSSDDDSHIQVLSRKSNQAASNVIIKANVNDTVLSSGNEIESVVKSPKCLQDSDMSECLNEVDSFNQKKERKKRRKGKQLISGLPAEIANDKTLLKYWYKRFSLFARFDQGIILDKESWFSVTPEKIAIHAANRLSCDLIVDAFCGCGGNSIQFAMTCKKVIAIDIDKKKVEMAKHNAKIYGVADKIDFIVGDFLQLYSNIKADIIFLSPPWGGPDYVKNNVYDIEKSLLPISGSILLEKCREITPNIAIFLPRNTNTHQLIKLAGVGNNMEIEQNFLDRKLISLTAYYGNLVGKKKD